VETPARVIHAQLANQCHVTKKLVAEVVGRSAVRPLTDALRREVGERYRQFVERMERPPESRHRILAREFGLSRPQVNEVLAALGATLPNPRDADRAALLRIEQAYWRHLQEGRTPLDAIPAAIASEQSADPWVVARYLDMIHDDPARLSKVPLPDEATRRRILEGYARYLTGEMPYPDGLHATIAAETGASVRQVHRVLLEYRWDARRSRAQPDEAMKA